MSAPQTEPQPASDYVAIKRRVWLWHEFIEDIDDGSMCICGVPVLTHDVVFPPEPSGGDR